MSIWQGQPWIDYEYSHIKKTRKAWLKKNPNKNAEYIRKCRQRKLEVIK
jgi:hypothetical protein